MPFFYCIFLIRGDDENKKTAKCDRNRPEMHYLCPQAVRQRDGLEFVVCVNYCMSVLIIKP